MLEIYKSIRKTFAINQKHQVFRPKKGRGSYRRKGRRIRNTWRCVIDPTAEARGLSSRFQS